MTNEEGGIDPEEARYEMLVDRVNTTATVWLGTTLGCAQCHNHKYDPFTQKDYYRMMAFFQNSDYDAKTFGDGTRYFEATIDVPTPEQEAKRKTIQEEIDELAADAEDRHAGYSPASRRAGNRRCGSSHRARGNVRRRSRALPRAVSSSPLSPTARSSRPDPNPGRDGLHHRGERRLLPRHHGDPTRSSAGSLVAERRSWPRPLRQLPVQRHRDRRR